MYETTDLYVAVALRAAGFHLDTIAPFENTKKAVFTFDQEHPSLDYPLGQAVKDFWDRKLPVDAREFVDALNEIKTRTYSIMG